MFKGSPEIVSAHLLQIWIQAKKSERCAAVPVRYLFGEVLTLLVVEGGVGPAGRLRLPAVMAPADSGEESFTANFFIPNQWEKNVVIRD